MAEFKFELTYTDYPDGAGTTTEIEEPKGFTEFTSVLERQFDQGGVFFRFSESNIALEFPGVGRGILEDRFQELGVDTDVTLTVSRRDTPDDAYSIIYTGLAVMKNRVLTPEFFKVDFEEQSILNRINARKDIPVSLDATNDLEGNSIAALSADSITFAGKQILQNVILGTITETSTNFITWDADGTGLTYDENVLSPLNKLQWADDSYGFSQTATVLTGAVLTKMGGSILVPQISGFTNTFTVSLTTDITTVTTGSPTGNIIWHLMRITGQTPTVSQSLDSFDWDVSTGDLSNQDLALTSGSLTNPPGTGVDQFFIKVDASNLAGAGTTIDVDTKVTENYFDFKIQTQVVPPSSTVDTYYVHDVLEQVAKLITGQAARFASTLFGRLTAGYAANGCAGFIRETNGYKIRNVSRSVIGTFKDRIDSLKAIFNIGWGLEKDLYTNDVNLVRVEAFEYFFKDVLIVAFTEVEKDSYKEEYFNDLNFSFVNVGYEKYAQNVDLAGALEDPCTQASFNMPIDLSPNIAQQTGSKDLISKYIASDHIWELTRRKQYFIEDEASWSNDDDLFIIDLSDATTIRDDTNLHVSGFSDQNTAFNYLLNARFNLFNHANVINSVLYAKTNANTITNTEFKNNKDGRIMYASGFSSPCLGDTRAFATDDTGNTMDSDIIIENFESRTILFKPTKISFRVGMSATQMDDIVEAHRNGLPDTDGRDYGYIRITNPDGAIKQGWLLSLRYNQVDGIGTFEIIEQYGY